MYSHEDKDKNQLKRLTVNLNRPARERLDELKQRTRFSRGEIISKVVTDQPLPKHVLETDRQYLELTNKLTDINKALGSLSEDSDNATSLILEGLQKGKVPDDDKYRKILAELRQVHPQVQRVNQDFRELQRANLFFLYGHRHHR